MEWFDKNATTIIAAGAALLSALIAGGFAILSSWLNNTQNNHRLSTQLNHEKNKESRKLFIEKGEELHSCVEKWTESCYAQLLSGRKFLNGEITLEQRASLLEPYEDKVNSSRLNTLMGIYFFELSELKVQCDAALDKCVNALKINPAKRVSLIETHNNFDEGYKAFQNASDKFLVQLQAKLLEQVHT